MRKDISIDNDDEEKERGGQMIDKAKGKERLRTEGRTMGITEE